MRSRPRRKSTRLVVVALLICAAVLGARAVVAAPDARGLRAACEAALERGVDARTPCHEALLYGSLTEDLRNQVAAMVAPGVKVTLDDLATASMVADAAVRKEATDPWGYVARCDIARRIGSADVLAACLRDLERIAPNHPATAAARAMQPVRVPAWVWIVRALLAIAFLGTLAHALRRWRGRRAAVARPVLALCVLASLLATRGAFADEGMSTPDPAVKVVNGRPMGGDLSDNRVDDANPEASVPPPEVRSRQPLQFGYFIQDLTARAEAATAKGDHVRAGHYWAALAKAAPDIALPPRKLCEELQAAGDLVNAVKACRSALTRGGVVGGDFTRFVSLVLAQPDPLPTGEKEELDAVLAHVDGKIDLGPQLPSLRCEVALRFHDDRALATCADELGRVAPDDPKTISFQWALAIANRDPVTAEKLIARARGVGMPQEGVATMERATSDMNHKRLARFVLLVIVAAALMLLGVRVLRRLAERRRAAA